MEKIKCYNNSKKDKELNLDLGLENGDLTSLIDLYFSQHKSDCKPSKLISGDLKRRLGAKTTIS